MDRRPCRQERWSYLVRSAKSAATVDRGSRTGGLGLDGEGILAYGSPPDVGQGARTLAVDTLPLVGSDDDVGQRAAFHNVKHTVRVPAFRLASALNTTVVRLHAAVKRFARGDGLGSVENDIAGRRGHFTAAAGTSPGGSGSGLASGAAAATASRGWGLGAGARAGASGLCFAGASGLCSEAFCQTRISDRNKTMTVQIHHQRDKEKERATNG